MTALDSIPNTTRINYLNIGLMGLSAGVAFFVPFELFLFSYAVLGPGHYFTEISWLHERKYFTKERFDLLFLLLSCAILFFLVYLLPDWKILHPVAGPQLSKVLLYAGAAASVCMVFLRTVFQRFLAFLVICVGTFFSGNTLLLFSVFVPTLIHVYVFTGLFMLYGSLKGRSKSGYLACVIFALLPLLFIFIHPEMTPLSAYALSHYPMFERINEEVLKIFNTSGNGTTHHLVYYSTAGTALMRFIAFAYTYHYLNWFSKTNLIGWHKVPRRRLLIIGVLWICAVALYAFSFRIGFYVLLLLSFLHVFLEFPLNRVTFVGIFKELRLISGRE